MTKNKNSVQGLICLERFTRFGVKTDKVEIVFFSVEPTNISVLSAANIDVKIHHLMMLLSTIPDLEILALDSCECFDSNKNHLRKRLEKEQKDAARDPHEATIAQTGDGLPEGQRLGAAQKAAHGVQKFNFAHGYALGPKRCACAWYGRGHGSDLARGFRYNWGEIFS